MTNRQVRFAAENIEHEVKEDEFSDEFALSGDEDESSGTKKRHFNKFELLDLVEAEEEKDEEEDDDDEEEEEDGATTSDNKEDSKQSSKSRAGSANKQSVVIENDNSKSSSKRKARKKRNKSKANKGLKSDGQDPDDELANLARAISRPSEPDAKVQTDDPKYKFLKVDMRNLVPETEIKRIFGKGVVKEDKSRPKHHPGLNLQRSRLVSSGYFEVKSSGVLPGPKMELDDKINKMRIGYTTGGREVNSGSTLFNSSEPIYFKFVHEPSYQEVQRLFLDAVHRGNSDFIVQNLEAMPTHAESLIQLSHMLRVSEDYKTASEFIERALVVFERGFHPRFNLATATCRLSYKRPENRTFFITIFKHISACHRRGLRRTPFEYSKLLLSLEPDNDPLMAVQLLDFYAIRSEEYDYLIDFYTHWEQLQKLPNLRFSLAMAHFLKSRNTKRARIDNDASLKQADECLQKALMLFPNFIIPLLDACSGEPDSELKKCSYFDYSVYGTKYKLVPETVDVLVALYVKRTYSLWKQKHVIAWLERNIAEMVHKFSAGELIDDGQHTQHWSTFIKVCPKNLLRHIVLCDLGLTIPPSASTSSYIDLDPYPPTDSIVSYSTSLSSGARTSSGVGGSLFEGFSGLFFRSMLPSFSLAEESAAPPTTIPTTSRQGRRNRPPQRPANTARDPETGVEVTRATIDDGFDLDYESIEYSLLIDALRDLPPLGPNSTQETTRNDQPQVERPRGGEGSGGDTGESGNQLRRRQPPPP